MQEVCSDTRIQRIKGISQTYIDRLQLGSFTCVQNSTYKVNGNILDNAYTTIQVSIQKCRSGVPGLSCQSDTEITRVLKLLEVQLVFLNANFDSQDIVQPVK